MKGIRVKVRQSFMYAIFMALVFLPSVSNAADFKLVPSCAHKPGGCDKLGQLLEVLVNYGAIVMGVSGAVALLFFIWGGIQMLSSGGNSDRVTSGKNSITYATIGLIIIFGSFTAVKFILKVLGVTKFDHYVS